MDGANCHARSEHASVRGQEKACRWRYGARQTYAGGNAAKHGAQGPAHHVSDEVERHGLLCWCVDHFGLSWKMRRFSPNSIGIES